MHSVLGKCRALPHAVEHLDTLFLHLQKFCFKTFQLHLMLGLRRERKTRKVEERGRGKDEEGRGEGEKG